MRTLVWFRGKDLRLADHAPLREACRAGEVIPLFVLDPYFFVPERARALPHRMQFLLESLAELEGAIAARGSRLLVVRGRSVDVVPRLAVRWKVDRVAAHRWSEPFGRERDRRITAALAVPFDLSDGETLLPPGSVRTGGGTPYQVYTPFARAAQDRLDAVRPLPAPRRLPPLPAGVTVRAAAPPALPALGISRNDALPAGGEAAARRRLRRFTRARIASYDHGRDELARDATSRLSADLHFGTLSVRAVWHAVAGHRGAGAARFRSQLLWREFAHHTLWHRRDVLHQPFRPEWRGFPWRRSKRDWQAWTEGCTGYPLVDAAARQLRAEGFVHNRARMIAASFLTKQLLIDWRRGQDWYGRWLVDGDWANNSLGWQWSAGCGCDAQPWFRIFNPTLQGRTFDPDGAYVRRWLPELAGVADRDVHKPWRPPVVDLAYARGRFLGTARKHLSR